MLRLHGAKIPSSVIMHGEEKAARKHGYLTRRSPRTQKKTSPPNQRGEDDWEILKDWFVLQMGKAIPAYVCCLHRL